MVQHTKKYYFSQQNRNNNNNNNKREKKITKSKWKIKINFWIKMKLFLHTPLDLSELNTQFNRTNGIAFGYIKKSEIDMKIEMDWF